MNGHLISHPSLKGYSALAPKPAGTRQQQSHLAATSVPDAFESALHQADLDGHPAMRGTSLSAPHVRPLPQPGSSHAQAQPASRQTKASEGSLGAPLDPAEAIATPTKGAGSGRMQDPVGGTSGQVSDATVDALTVAATPVQTLGSRTARVGHTASASNAEPHVSTKAEKTSAASKSTADLVMAPFMAPIAAAAPAAPAALATIHIGRGSSTKAAIDPPERRGGKNIEPAEPGLPDTAAPVAAATPAAHAHAPASFGVAQPTLSQSDAVSSGSVTTANVVATEHRGSTTAHLLSSITQDSTTPASGAQPAAASNLPAPVIAAPDAVANQTSTSSIAAAVSSPQPAVEQVLPAMISLASHADGSSQMTVSLSPKDLGKVDIHLVREADGSTTVTVTATEAHTLQELTQNAHHLHAALDAASLPSDGRTINFVMATDPSADPGDPSGRNNDPAASMEQRDGSSGQGQASQQQNARPAGSTQDHDTASPTPPIVTRQWQSRGLNITA